MLMLTKRMRQHLVNQMAQRDAARYYQEAKRRRQAELLEAGSAGLESALLQGWAEALTKEGVQTPVHHDLG